jgi:hypothetical protein
VEFILAHPLFVIIAGAVVTAFFGLLGFLLSQYAFTPKRCKGQVEDCRKMIAEQFSKRDAQKEHCVGDIEKQSQLLHGRITSFAEKADQVYVRRDAVLPQLDLIQKEMTELRLMIFKFLKANGHGG